MLRDDNKPRPGTCPETNDLLRGQYPGKLILSELIKRMTIVRILGRYRSIYLTQILASLFRLSFTDRLLVKDLCRSAPDPLCF